jgi:hypothetical protein
MFLNSPRPRFVTEFEIHEFRNQSNYVSSIDISLVGGYMSADVKSINSSRKKTI